MVGDIYDLNNDPKYQNAMEFIGANCGLALMVSLGYHKAAFVLQGDSVVALNWTKRQHFPAGACQAGAIQYIHLSTSEGIDLVVAASDQIDTKHNDRSDGLSRGKTPQQIGAPPAACLDINNNPTLREWVFMMNPKTPINLNDDLHLRWEHAGRLMATLMSPTGGWICKVQRAPGR